MKSYNGVDSICILFQVSKFGSLLANNSQRRLGSVTNIKQARGGLYVETSSCRNLRQVTWENVFRKALENSILVLQHSYFDEICKFGFEYKRNTTATATILYKKPQIKNK